MTSTTDFSPDARAAAGRDWACAALGLKAADFAPASADASFRRYFRLTSAGKTWVLMDAPPDKEDSRPFIRIAGLLHEAGLNGPVIHAQDLARGYLLLSDLGRQTFLHVINESNADGLFDCAIDALIRWQLSSRLNELPPYDEALLRRELALFPDWYIGRHLKRAPTAGERSLLAEIDGLLVKSALAQPRVYVHRDYMPRNLMISEPNPGVLDFQDAVCGPITYDVASLFKDAFLSWPEERVRGWARLYWERARAAHLPVDNEFSEFYRAFEWMGMQRHMKVIGIFARINYRDGKPHYLADVPRFIKYVRDAAGRNSALTPALRLFDKLGMHA